MKNILRISDFNEIVKGIKAMKSDLVCVYKNQLIGVDNTMSVMKIYNMSKEIPIEPFTIITKTLSSEFYSNITDTEIVIDTDNCNIYCPNNVSYAENKIMINLFVTNNIINRYLSISGSIVYSFSNNLIEFGDITNDLNFDIIRNLKAADGARLYCPNGNKEYGMYLYNGALPINKSDKIYLNIYDQGTIFISVFIIDKKKVGKVTVIFKFIKLNELE